MPAKPHQKTRKHNGGLIRPTPEGTFQAEINQNKKRIRKTFPSIQECANWIDSHVSVIGPIHLTARHLYDAQAALRILPPGVTLATAAAFYAQHNGGHVALSIQDAVKKYLTDKEHQGLRQRTIDSYTLRLLLLVNTLPAKTMTHEVTAEEIRVIASTMKGHTRNGFVTVCRSFFAWAIKTGYAYSNPAERVEKARIDDSIAETLTIDQCRALLRSAMTIDHWTLPYIAVCLFAGLRPSECQRIDASSIDLERGLIRLGPKQTKTRRQRFVTIFPVLGEWLTRYGTDTVPRNRERQRMGKIHPRTLDIRVEKIRTHAGIDHWPADAMRHTYATMHLAKHTDAPALALQMGNSVDVIMKHYRNLATAEEAEEFWSICPGDVLKIRNPSKHGKDRSLPKP